MSRASKLITAVVLAGVAGIGVLLWVEGLDRAEKWVSIIGVVVIGGGGLVLGWLSWRQQAAVPPRTEQPAGPAASPATPQPPPAIPVGGPPRRADRDNAIIAAVVTPGVIIGGVLVILICSPLGSFQPDGAHRPGNEGASLSSTAAATSTAPAMPDGVTYHCTGSAPPGIDITYGPKGSNLAATKLPFTARGSVSASAWYYHLRAQLPGGGGYVTCTLTVTDDGRTTTSSGTARGGHKIASAQICGDSKNGWNPC